MWSFAVGDIVSIWWQNETNEKMNSWYLFILWLYYSIFLVRKLNKCLNCGFVVVSDLLYVYSKILQIPTEQTISVTPRSDVSPNPDDPNQPGVLNNKIKRVWLKSGNTSYKLLKLEHEEPEITRRMDRMIEQVPARQAARFCSDRQKIRVDYPRLSLNVWLDHSIGWKLGLHFWLHDFIFSKIQL